MILFKYPLIGIVTGLHTCLCRKRQKVIPLVEAYLCDCPIEYIAYPVEEYKNKQIINK